MLETYVSSFKYEVKCQLKYYITFQDEATLLSTVGRVVGDPAV
jgi:hypothetical protein